MHAFLALVVYAAAAALAAPPARDVDKFDALISAHARKNGLDPRLVKALIAVESEFQPRAVSRAGARGLMQLMPATALEVGASPRRLFNPSVNIAAGTAYLKILFRFEQRRQGLAGTPHRDAPMRVVRRVVAAYNCGPSCLMGRRWPPETRAYVRRVFQYYGSPFTAVDGVLESPGEPDLDGAVRAADLGPGKRAASGLARVPADGARPKEVPARPGHRGRRGAVPRRGNAGLPADPEGAS